MPYKVLDQEDMYGTAESNADALEKALNFFGDQGWSVVGIVPQHALHDDSSESEGQTGPYLILHKAEDSEPGTLHTF